MRTRPRDRAAVLLALGFVLRAHPDPLALAALGAMAAGPDEGLAARAIDALARTRAEGAAEVLRPLAGRPDEWLRAKVADALGPLPGPAARPLLLELSRDESPLVRAAATFSPHASASARESQTSKTRTFPSSPSAATWNRPPGGGVSPIPRRSLIWSYSPGVIRVSTIRAVAT
jgi:hypothetical protein